MIELRVKIDAEVRLTCDRCLDEFECPVHFEGQPVVKISDTIPEGEQYSGDAHREVNNSDGDILWISPAEATLDLGQYIYESIMLSLPFQRVHPELKDCNQEMDRFRRGVRRIGRRGECGSGRSGKSFRRPQRPETQRRQINNEINQEKWHILNTRSHRPVGTREELTIRPLRRPWRPVRTAVHRSCSTASARNAASTAAKKRWTLRDNSFPLVVPRRLAPSSAPCCAHHLHHTGNSNCHRYSGQRATGPSPLTTRVYPRSFVPKPNVIGL